MKIQIQSDWTVEETLRQYPQSSPGFIRNRMQCIGCYMQKFCRIKDVAEIYKVDLSAFMQDLNSSENKNNAVKEK